MSNVEIISARALIRGNTVLFCIIRFVLEVRLIKLDTYILMHSVYIVK